MQADIDEIVLVKMVGELADLLIRVDPSYEQFVTYEGKQRVIYTELDKALYGTLQGALLFWKKLSSYLIDTMGFRPNPYDACVVNREIDGHQCTIGWHVDDLKISHVKQSVTEKVLNKIKVEFGREAPLTVTRGMVHQYLGMTIDYSKDEKVSFDMTEYLQQIIDETPEELLKGSVSSPAANHLFQVNDEAEKLDPATAIIFHHLVAQLLYLAKRTRPDILTCISFLTSRVQCPDVDDWKKLGRCVIFLRSTKTDKMTLEANSLNTMYWWIDASFGVHPNMRSHTGTNISFGKGSPYSISSKQKIKTQSSTEAEVVGVNDALYLVLWTRNFMEAQGYHIQDNVIYQNNESSILLETNGKKSSKKNTRHMEIRYFFVTDYVKQEKIRIKYCHTDDMVADYFTKPLQGSKFQKFRRFLLNLREPMMDDPHSNNVKPDKSKVQECVGNCEGTHNSNRNLMKSYREALINGADQSRGVGKIQMDGSGGLSYPSSTMYVMAR